MQYSDPGLYSSCNGMQYRKEKQVINWIQVCLLGLNYLKISRLFKLIKQTNQFCRRSIEFTSCNI